jgi:hypothetical protein
MLHIFVFLSWGSKKNKENTHQKKKITRHETHVSVTLGKQAAVPSVAVIFILYLCRNEKREKEKKAANKSRFILTKFVVI